MLNLARAIFGIGAKPRDREHEKLVKLATDRVIEGTDPRLRAVGGHERKLREPVERAVEFALAVGEHFHPPVELVRTRYASDPQIWGFLGSADRVDEVLRESREVHEFLAEPGNLGLTEVYAGLAMERIDKRVLAPSLRGDVVERDTLRDVVTFAAHRVVLPAGTEEGFVHRLQERSFMALVEVALERLLAIRERKRDLEADRMILARKLKTLKARGLAMQPLAAPAPGPSEDTATLERRLEETERELRSTTASIATLDESLGQVADVMAHPEDHMSFTRTSARITRMGFRAEADDQDPGEEIHFTEIRIGEHERIAGCLVRCPCPVPAP